MADATAQLTVEGFGSGGEPWTLIAQPSRAGRLRTTVSVVEDDGYRWTAGFDSPTMPPGHRAAVFAGRSGRRSQLLIVRVDTDVRAVIAMLDDGTREDLSLHGDPSALGARVAVLVHPAELEVASLRLIGDDGSVLPETFSPGDQRR